MPLLHHLVIVFALVVSVIATSSSSLCLKGCCGLQLQLPSSHLSFLNPSAKEPQAVISLQHTHSGITCCPCPDSVDDPIDNKMIVGEASILSSQNTTAQASLEQQALAAGDCGVYFTHDPGCPPAGCVHHISCRKVGAQKMATKAVDEAILDAETNNGDGACEDCPYVTHDAGCPPAGCVHHVCCPTMHTRQRPVVQADSTDGSNTIADVTAGDCGYITHDPGCAPTGCYHHISCSSLKSALQAQPAKMPEVAASLTAGNCGVYITHDPGCPPAGCVHHIPCPDTKGSATQQAATFNTDRSEL